MYGLLGNVRTPSQEPVLGSFFPLKVMTILEYALNEQTHLTAQSSWPSFLNYVMPHSAFQELRWGVLWGMHNPFSEDIV